MLKFQGKVSLPINVVKSVDAVLHQIIKYPLDGHRNLTAVYHMIR